MTDIHFKPDLPQNDTISPSDGELAKWLQSTHFLTSAPKFRLCPPDTGVEIAFAGRSNAGKSSAINTITRQKQLARSSKTPGRTQMINFFEMDSPERRLVDLPGYGYAAVSESIKDQWQKELERYLLDRHSLRGLVLLMDIRHPLQNYDRMMLDWAKQHGLFVHILLTKADKLNRGPANQQLLSTIKELKKIGFEQPSIQLFSSLNRQGIEELNRVLATRLNFPNDPLALPSDIDITAIPLVQGAAENTDEQSSLEE